MPSDSSYAPAPGGPQAHDWLTGGGELGQLIRGYDWSKTPLGPIESWPQSLRSAVSILLPSKAQIAMFWGPDLITLYNDAYRPVLGQKHPEALGQPVREVWSELWDTGLRSLFEGVLQTGEAFWASDWPFNMKRFGFPEETFFDISYDPIRGESGKVDGLFCIVSESTARVVGARRLRTLRDLSLFASAAANSVEDACRSVAEILSQNRHDVPFALIYLLDKSGKNATLAGVSGLEPGTRAASLSVNVSHPESDTACWPFSAVMQTNRAVEITDVVQRCGELVTGVWPEPVHTAMMMPIGASGQDRAIGFLVAGVSPRRPFDDQYRGFFELLTTQISTTVSNARAYEEERRRAESLAELDRAKTAFFSNVSHEFRTPLTLMLGPVADALAELDGSSASQAQRENLEIAYRNGLRLQKLVNTLLDFSRIEAGRVQASFEPAALAAMTAELASNFRSACERAGIELVVDCPSLDEPVYVDPDMWEKVVLNLVSNAFKFTFAGRIEVSLRKTAEHVVLTVSDTGVGIPADELPKLFERFHQVEVSRGRTQEGSGIGLALVRELVKLHGGAVRVESELGEGSVFTVCLPRGKDHLPQDRINAARTMTSTSLGAAPFVSEALRWLPHSAVEASVAAASAPHAGEKRFHILLADDNADMRDYVSRLLSDRYDILAVADGQAAWNAIEQNVPDLILSDVMMPVLDGFELLRRIRANPHIRETPVVLLSARAGEEARIEGLKASADDYIVKPFSARELLATVDAHLKTLNIRRQNQEALAGQNKRLAVLWEAAGVLLTNKDPDSMLSELFLKIRESLSLDVYFNFMVSETGDALELVSCAGVDPETMRSISRLEFGQAVCGNVALRRAPIVATYIQQSAEPMVQLVKGFGLRAYACNPLIAGGQLLGTLSFASRRRDTFDREELEFLETISHYVTLAYERLRLIERLREQDQRKDEFLATLAHELRNPLAPIRNGLELIRLSNGNPATLERATTIMQRQIEQMVRLVDDLLDVSRISHNRLELRKEQVGLEAIVRSAVETSRPVLDAAKSDLRVELPSEPVLLDADPVRLAQVFSNLLNNAAKYSVSGGSVSLVATRTGDEVTIRVRDTGIGIEPGKLAQIFGMFVQLDVSEQQIQTGLGVGLTLVQRLIEMHGGSVEARSEDTGRGSEFVVRLPALPQTTEASLANESAVSDQQSARRRILVVDDNFDSAESMAMMLTLSGHHVAMAHDGEEAVRLAQEFQPDLALLDIGMPKLDGYEAARSIRRQSWGQGMMLIALTGWGQAEDKRRSREAGFDAHLVKPVDFDALEKLVASSKDGNGSNRL
ncbi:MAG TPA: ATP-binding protein [Pyrinomonadaceae bacterium]|nr:ATP-binding protein [Pyrinomonadaceae bacterium]